MTDAVIAKGLLAQVVSVMKAEAEAIAQAASRCRVEAVERAVHYIAECKGKVVVSGAGKSGIVGHKIASTLSSTGTLAIYLHPADAIHGELGLLAAGDVGLLLSNSGESDEVLALVPHMKRRGVPLIALVGNPNSTLARAADAVLDARAEREACPLNLAPTASTAVALALGDALALVVMQLRGFTPEDFARNHPGGRIGKRLTLRVGDLMHGGADNPTAEAGAGWDTVLDVLCKHSLGAVNVVDPQGRLIGLVTDGDIRRAIRSARPHSEMDVTAMTAFAMMTRNPVTVSPEVLAYDALRLMEDRPSQISVLPVTDPVSGRCLGLLRLHDIVRSGLT
jgi:arabinose-5-phosphate isomerase